MRINKRTIKFRAWDSLHQKMFDWGDNEGWFPVVSFDGRYLEISDGGWSDSKDPHMILMQFTGLHDKNGREIYEGDIIKADGILHDSVTFVLEDMMQGNWKNLDNKEVIGNIYENPDLLTNDHETE